MISACQDVNHYTARLQLVSLFSLFAFTVRWSVRSAALPRNRRDLIPFAYVGRIANMNFATEAELHGCLDSTAVRGSP